MSMTTREIEQAALAGGALLQLELQRRQLGVLQRDLSKREQLLERQQANHIDLTWTGNADGYRNRPQRIRPAGLERRLPD